MFKDIFQKPGSLEGCLPDSHIFFLQYLWRSTYLAPAKCIDLLEPSLFKLISAKLFYPILRIKVSHQECALLSGQANAREVKGPAWPLPQGHLTQVKPWNGWRFQGADCLHTERASFSTEPVCRLFTGSDKQLLKCAFPELIQSAGSLLFPFCEPDDTVAVAYSSHSPGTRALNKLQVLTSENVMKTMKPSPLKKKKKTHTTHFWMDKLRDPPPNCSVDTPKDPQLPG